VPQCGSQGGKYIIQDILPTSSVLSYKIRLNISTGNLDISGMIHEL